MNDRHLQTARSSYIVVFLGLVFQILIQFGLQVLLARLYGATADMDAYRTAIRIPVMLSAMLSGTFVPVLIPRLGRRASASDAPLTATSGAVTWVVLSVILLGGMIGLLGWLFSPVLVGWLLPHEEVDDFALTVELFRILIWLLPANVLIGLFQAVLNARLNFWLPALAGVLGPGVTLAIVILYGDTDRVDVIASGTLWGALTNVCIQALPAARILWRLRGPLLKEELWDLLGAAVPVFLALLFLKIDPVVDAYVAQFLVDGSLARLDYATQILSVFLTLTSGTLSTVAFPRIAQFSQSDRSQFIVEVANSLQTLTMLVVPALTVLGLFGPALIEDIFEGNQFLPRDTAIVGQLLAILSLLLLGGAVGELMAKTLYAQHDTRTTLIVSCLTNVTACTAKYLWAGELTVQSLAAITACTAIVGGTTQLFVVYRRFGDGIFRGVFRMLLISLCGAACAALTGGLCLRQQFPLNSLAGLALGAVAYFGIMLLFFRLSRPPQPS